MNRTLPFSARWVEVADLDDSTSATGFIGVVELNLPWRFGLLIGRYRNGRTYSAWAGPGGPMTLPFKSPEV
jgi:hypothetical protein